LHVTTRTGRSATRASLRRDTLAKEQVAAWVAWGICALYWVAISTGYALRLSHDVGFHVLDELGWRIGYGGCATVGAIIASRRPRNVLGWILCAVGLTIAVAGFAQDYAAYALLHRHDWLAGGLVLGWLGSWPWYIAFGLLFTFLLLLFPDGRLPSRRWRPLAWAAAVDIAVLTFWAAFAPRPLEGPRGTAMPQNPWAIERAAGLFRVLDDIAGLTLVALTGLSLALLVLRFRRSRGTQRQQLKWFTYAALLTVGSWVFQVATSLNERLSGPVWLLWLLFSTLSLWIIPAAIGIAILRYRLYDIDRLINRTLVFGLLTALFAAVYAGAVLVLGQLFGGLGGEPPSWVVAGATLAVAALFQPARRRIQQAVDRRFNRRKYDAAKTIEAFSTRLREQLDLDTLSAELLAVVGQTMQPTQASLWLRPPRDTP
jgi:MFS family permease